jgi:CRISPR system Cascade subunit CasD
VRIDQPGRPLRDYHTAQAPKARKGVRWRTRQEEVKDRLELYTVLSERLYRVEAVATVALWPRAGASIALDALAQALGRPRFCLYLGRKSCPLGEPTRPKVIEADALPEAFALYDDARRSEAAANPDVPGAASAPPDAPIWFELDAGLTTEEAGVDLIRQRRDGVRSRVLRQFSDRREARLGRAQPHPDPLQGIVS